MFDVTPVTTGRPFDCGPACMKMMLDYYKIDVELKTLIAECNTKMSGCSLKKLSEVGRAHGIDPVNFSMDADELFRQDRPAIIWWQYSHYVVFAGMNDKDEPVICNPNRGRYAIDKGTFRAMYTGTTPGMGIALFNGEPHDLPEE